MIEILLIIGVVFVVLGLVAWRNQPMRLKWLWNSKHEECLTCAELDGIRIRLHGWREEDKAREAKREREPWIDIPPDDKPIFHAVFSDEEDRIRRLGQRLFDKAWNSGK